MFGSIAAITDRVTGSFWATSFDLQAGRWRLMEPEDLPWRPKHKSLTSSVADTECLQAVGRSVAEAVSTGVYGPRWTESKTPRTPRI